MSVEKYELILIGSGTVSNDGMKEALAHGVKKILVIEKDETIGGTCLNWG
jgi:pyruvate/2-oxoglutarate dehydrogenase complex dihydrolipoamide dehydrogenase (E3) component